MRETDPVTLALVDGDLSFTAGRSSLASGAAAAVIGAETRISLIFGELVFNREVGIKWLENDLVPAASAILGQRFDRLKLRAAVREAILSTPAIVEILKLEVSFDVATRAALIVWRARCEFGEDTDVITTEVTI